MKYLVGFGRIFVGILFIISGFIKLNDPVGFSFKLQEYFSPGVLDLP
ncbi:MAG: DoxX family protein, partial [Bacteroidota bacterium]